MRKKKIILCIDTANNKITSIDLIIGSKKYSKQESRLTSSQTVLPLIDSLLRKQKLKLTDITEIKVQTGPGSFTGLRVGIAIANTLGFLLDIPVNGRRNLPVEPEYG